MQEGASRPPHASLLQSLGQFAGPSPWHWHFTQTTKLRTPPPLPSPPRPPPLATPTITQHATVLARHHATPTTTQHTTSHCHACTGEWVEGGGGHTHTILPESVSYRDASASNTLPKLYTI